MKVSKRQLRRIIKEEKTKLNEAALGGYSGYDSVVEEVMQELSTYHAETSAGGGDPDRNKQDAIDAGREPITGDIIWPRLEEALPHVWDTTIGNMANILFEDIAAEWLQGF